MLESFFSEITKNASGFVVVNNDKIAYSTYDKPILEENLQGQNIEEFLSTFMDADGLEVGSYPLGDNSAVVVVGETTGSIEEGQILSTLMDKVGMAPDNGLISAFVGSSYDIPVPDAGSAVSSVEPAPEPVATSASSSSSASISKPVLALIIGSIATAGVFGGMAFTGFEFGSTYEVQCPIGDNQIPEILNTREASQLVYLGNDLYKEGLYDEALMHYQFALIKDNKNIYALNGVGTTFEVLREYNNARLCYADTLEIDKNNINALNGMGNALVGLEYYEESLLHYEQALDLSPDSVNALNGMGNALVGLEYYEESLLHYEQTLDLSPDSVNALTGKCKAKIGLEEYAEAADHCDQALSISPNNSNALIGKSRALIGLGNYAEANTILDQVLEMNPDNVDAIAIKDKIR